MTQDQTHRIGYLINQYPKISHTFIRREILALEAQGVSIKRVSIRKSADTLYNESDIEESLKTTYILTKNLRCTYDLLLAAVRCLPRIVPAITTVMLIMVRSRSFTKPIAYLLEACWLYRLCTAERITHIHAHFGTNAASVAMLCRKLNGPTFSITIHGPEEFDSPLALALDKKVSESAFVVAISSFCRSQLFRWIQLHNWSKVVEIRCTIDDDFIAPANDKLIVHKHFVSIGRLCEQKGQLLLLQALAMVAQEHPDVMLHLVGDGELRRTLEDFIASHNLTANVQLHGWKDEKQISAHIDGCMALVLPSFAEGLPVVIMESFARRRPVLSTYVAGIPELIDKNCGWLVPAGNVYELRDAMIEIIHSPSDKLYEMGCHGLERVISMHNSRNEAHKLKQKLIQLRDPIGISYGA